MEEITCRELDSELGRSAEESDIEQGLSLTECRNVNSHEHFSLQYDMQSFPSKSPLERYRPFESSDEVLEKAVEEALAAGYRHFDTARAYENEAALGRALFPKMYLPNYVDEVLEKAVEEALAAGYRHFDTARAYENEAALGRALFPKMYLPNYVVVIRRGPREGRNRPESVQEYFDASFKDLGLDYIDLYLVHTPFAFEDVPGDLHPKNPDGTMKVDHSTDLLAVWKSILKLKETGRVRHVGVCNLNSEQLGRVSRVARPACLQVENHLLCQQPTLVEAARALGVPNISVWDFELSQKEMADLAALDRGENGRICDFSFFNYSRYLHYKLVCQPINDEPHGFEYACRVCYGYFVLKLMDLLDTVFFILRKKQSQVTFLHVYHHFGGHGTFLVTMNSFVHIIMYMYYLLTVWDESYKKSVWWKKYVTQIQICGYPREPAFILIPQNLFMVILFGDFYYRAYVKKPKKA
ncbi:Alcohol dehydrogenase AD5 [Operophtera brumata]|uniref:Alcohol dehydrogenase AD5 n=1 Tax=Operophtera brumata TaxID=104452 RepID=A0A0L7LNU9_OPEBR|nr:Alcohol dehydrogenase AD5 [Operophtera brumata]